MMKSCYIALLVIFIAGNAAAGGIELSKDAVSVSPPDPQGTVAIAGPPGCVVGLPPIYIMARNKKSGMVVNASALPNGAFSLRIPASGRDTVKITFISANGKKKDISVNVPEAAQEREGEVNGQGSAAARNPGRSEVNVDLGQFSEFGAPEVVQVRPDGKGGTIVHVGDRPPQRTPTPAPAETADQAPTPSPEPEETPPATPEGAEGSATPAADQTVTEGE